MRYFSVKICGKYAAIFVIQSVTKNRVFTLIQKLSLDEKAEQVFLSSADGMF